MKSEPDVFSIDDLKKEKKSWWTGVRNYQARNFMTQDMRLGDFIFFYHSSCEVPGIVGLARICSLAQPDPTQFDKKSEYYDKKSSFEKPIWNCTQVEFVEKFKQLFSLAEIKTDPQLSSMLVIKKGMRLSIQPVDKKDYDYILNKCSHR